MSLTAAQILFLQKAATAARASMAITGVPASVTIAQAILESGWGRSQLAIAANNFFGVKACQGEDYAEFPTAEYMDGVKEEVMARFARYPSPIESFHSHASLLLSLPRYAPAMAHRADPASFAAELQKCGYSTNPKYAEGLMQLVNEFGLTKYDQQPEPPQPQQATAPAEDPDPAPAQTQEQAA